MLEKDKLMYELDAQTELEYLKKVYGGYGGTWDA